MLVESVDAVKDQAFRGGLEVELTLAPDPVGGYVPRGACRRRRGPHRMQGEPREAEAIGPLTACKTPSWGESMATATLSAADGYR